MRSLLFLGLEDKLGELLVLLVLVILLKLVLLTLLLVVLNLLLLQLLSFTLLLVVLIHIIVGGEIGVAYSPASGAEPLPPAAFKLHFAIGGFDQYHCLKGFPELFQSFLFLNFLDEQLQSIIKKE
jgi:hypothetical protein